MMCRETGSSKPTFEDICVILKELQLNNFSSFKSNIKMKLNQSKIYHKIGIKARIKEKDGTRVESSIKLDSSRKC